MNAYELRVNDGEVDYTLFCLANSEKEAKEHLIDQASGVRLFHRERDVGAKLIGTVDVILFTPEEFMRQIQYMVQG